MRSDTARGATTLIAIAMLAGLLGAVAGCAKATGACRFNSDCAAGSYCHASACISDCTTDAQCVASHGAGATCSPFGMCVGGSDSGATGDGGGADAGASGPLRAFGSIGVVGDRRSAGSLVVMDDGFEFGDRVCAGTLCATGGLVP